MLTKFGFLKISKLKDGVELVRRRLASIQHQLASQVARVRRPQWHFVWKKPGAMKAVKAQKSLKALKSWRAAHLPRKRRKLQHLRLQDAERQAERLVRLAKAQNLVVTPVYAASAKPAAPRVASAPKPAKPATPAPLSRPQSAVASAVSAPRSQKYSNSFDMRPVRRAISL